MTAVPLDLVCIGEGMAERRLSDDSITGFGGDCMNTAIYAGRCGASTALLTMLGDDEASTELLTLLALEGIDTSNIRRIAGSQLGSYRITVNDDGERTFAYDRDHAPARQLFQKDASAGLPAARCLFYSAITLAILAPNARQRLLAKAQAFQHAGGRVAFDTNFRARLWGDAIRDAWAAILPHMRTADIGFFGVDDISQIFGATPFEDYRALASPNGEIIIKDGANGSYVLKAGAIDHVPAASSARIVDTTAAGDSFNGAYLAARLIGATPQESAQAGNILAAQVIQHPGALMPRL
jgi:2-dehydro-3-deoxygluconokinase